MNKRFHLVITETIANEHYDAEMTAYEARHRYNQQFDPPSNYPSKDREIKVLSVTVTETEFAAIKKAALETMA